MLHMIGISDIFNWFSPEFLKYLDDNLIFFMLWILSAETPNWRKQASPIPVDFDPTSNTLIARPRNIFQSFGLCCSIWRYIWNNFLFISLLNSHHFHSCFNVQLKKACNILLLLCVALAWIWAYVLLWN